MQQRIEKTVFISYRRTNVPWALNVYQDLTHHGYDVFFDYEGIGSGDFESVILGNITARAHFLVLLTPSALERCGNPGDWLRREIETAIECKRNIVPLMLEGFSFGTPAIANQLTGTLANLKELQRNWYAGGVLPGSDGEAADKIPQRTASCCASACLASSATGSHRAKVCSRCRTTSPGRRTYRAAVLRARRS
jgi:hypothetical protein